MRILQLTAMHGRHDTVRYCVNKMPWIDKLYAVSTDDDIEFVDSMLGAIDYYIITENNPLSAKWQALISVMDKLEYDAVIIMGSDDWMDHNTYRYISQKLNEGHDFIGFTDCFFTDGPMNYYWQGYQNSRYNEPIGCGRTLSKDLLKRINYNLFRYPLDRGLDRSAWNIIQPNAKNPHIASLKKENLFLCDMKDKESMNPIRKINGIVNLN